MKLHHLFARTAVAFSAAALVVSAFGQAKVAEAQPPITLKVGDTAPPLAVSGWVKGTPVTNLADGKVHIVEFWATWCGPCKGSMPHLSAVAKRFRGKADVVGVDVWESIHGGSTDATAVGEKVKSFVQYAGDTMDYNVATDTADGTIAKTWLAAAGQRGIPCTFVVDQEGKIAWIGHPLYGLGEVVDLVLQRRLDAAAADKIKADWRQRFETFWDISGKFDEAIKAKDYTKAGSYADETAKLIPDLGDADTMRLTLLLNTDRPAARRLAERSLRERANDPQTLFEQATSILDAPGTTPEDGKVALKLAQAAAKRYPPSEPYSLRVLAQAYHAAGDDAKAAENQKRYLDYLSDPELKAPQKYIDEAKDRLKTYQAGTR